MIEKTTAGSKWPQYKKFSKAPSTGEIITKVFVGIAAAATVAAIWIPGQPVAPHQELRPASYTTLPRVEIVGKLAHIQQHRLSPFRIRGRNVSGT